MDGLSKEKSWQKILTILLRFLKTQILTQKRNPKSFKNHFCQLKKQNLGYLEATSLILV